MKAGGLPWTHRSAVRALRLVVEGIHTLRCSLNRITIFAASAFMALLKKIELSYILLIGSILSILLFGFLL